MDIARELNAAQLEAATAGDGPLLILAGAGTGKTRVLTFRVARLLERGIPAHRILAVTFTNKAAGEMRSRLLGLCGEAARGLWVGTFHATCARLLRIHGADVGLDPSFVIYDEDDQRRLVAGLLKQIGAPEKVTPRAVLDRIDDLKNRGIEPSEASLRLGGSQLDVAVREIYPAYQQALRRESAVDFGDLLLLTLRLLRATPAAEHLRGRFEQVLVDEFQDTNRIQYELVRELSAGHGNLAVVGDDDQAIYAWRGADVRNILDFERDFPTARVVKLERNYRSTEIILAAANAVIARNAQRMGKTLYTEQKGGEPILLLEAGDERYEAELLTRAIRELVHAEGRSPRDFAVLYRTHAQSRVLEEALRAVRVPYAIVGSVAFYGRREIKDAIAYLRLASPSPPRNLDVERVINVPARGIGGATLEKLGELARQRQLTLFEACRAAAGDPGAGLGGAARRRVGEFVALVESLRVGGLEAPPSQLLKEALERTGLLAVLSDSPAPEDAARRENLDELVAAVKEYEERSPDPTLTGFLEYAALVSPADDQASDEDGGQVTLTTIHAAKGLEFPVVLLAGLEEGVFPSMRAVAGGESGPRGLDEERRLAYVALTRARERLVLSFAHRRRIYDRIGDQEPSRFLREIPASLVVVPRRAAPRPPSPMRPPPQRSRPADEVYVEYDGDRPGRHAAPLDSLYVGARVRHDQFGVGTVRGLSGGGHDAKLRVDFGSEGERTVLARFLAPA